MWWRLVRTRLVEVDHQRRRHLVCVHQVSQLLDKQLALGLPVIRDLLGCVGRCPCREAHAGQQVGDPAWRGGEGTTVLALDKQRTGHQTRSCGSMAEWPGMAAWQHGKHGSITAWQRGQTWQHGQAWRHGSVARLDTLKTTVSHPVSARTAIPPRLTGSLRFTLSRIMTFTESSV